jgi:hypothetical protein
MRWRPGYIAMRFEHALQAARGLADAHLSNAAFGVCTASAATTSRLSARARKVVGFVPTLVSLGLTGRGWLVAKLVSELPAEVTTEVEIARLERDERDGVADLGLPLAETKQLTAALQAKMVPAQVIMVGERRRSCVTCGCVRALHCDVPLPVRRGAGRSGTEAHISSMRLRHITDLFRLFLPGVQSVGVYEPAERPDGAHK